MFRVLYLFTIIIAVYKLFYLTPLAEISGRYSVADLGLILTIVGLLWRLFVGGSTAQIKNPLSILILLYFLMLAMHVALAAIHYNQSLVNGLVAVRWHFFYLLFFLFVLLLDSDDKLVRFFNYLSVLALFVMIISIVNYFGIPILYHSKAIEGWGGMRAGIDRVFVPGMALVSLSYIWQLTQWVSLEKWGKYFSGLMAALLAGGHFFQQSRGGIFGVLLATIIIFLLKKKLKDLLILALFGIASVFLAGIFMEENIFLHPFTSGADDIIENSGTVSDRVITATHALNEFKRHPLIGSGVVAVRVGEINKTEHQDIRSITYQSDLGYIHWIKNYGLTGVVWLACFFWFLYSRNKLLLRKNKSNQLDVFSMGYLWFVMLTFLTLNHLMDITRIVLLCLVSAVIYRKSINSTI